MTTEKKGFDLSDKLKGVSKLNIGLQEQPQLEYIDIDLIDPDPRNRKVEGIPELAQNIALVGLQQPLAVRANPDAEGRYMAISGHRRRLAIKQLVDEGEEKFRAVPCLVAPPGMSDAMVRLMILSGNMVTQSLTSAQMADATKEMEDAIYQLKEEGHEFPGKVRDLVGKACGIAGSRVTRLNGIRKKLIDQWKGEWEAGMLNESAADQMSHLIPSEQQDIYAAWLKSDRDEKYTTAWRIEAMGGYFAQVARDCPHSCGLCDRDEARRTAIIAAAGQYVLCSRCCCDCYKRFDCDKLCGHAAEAVQAEKTREAGRNKAEAQKRELIPEEEIAKKEEKLRFTTAGWRRLGEALDRAGKSALWLTELLGWYSDEDELAVYEHLLHGGEVTKDNLWIAEDHPLQDIYTADLIKLANELGVSIDYLFGRTDEPGGEEVPPEESGKWVCLDWIPPHKKPDDGGLVALKYDLDNGKEYATVGRCLHGKWCTRAGTPTERNITGWFPLPWTAENEEDPEE